MNTTTHHSIFIRIFLCITVIFVSLSTGPISRSLAAQVIYVDASATGANDGTSWADAFTDLQDALAAAVSGDEIWVAAGTYYPGQNRAASFHLKSGVAIYGGFPPGGGDFASRDWENNPTILSGDIGTPGNDSDHRYHVVVGDSIDETSIVDGVTPIISSV